MFAIFRRLLNRDQGNLHKHAVSRCHLLKTEHMANLPQDTYELEIRVLKSDLGLRLGTGIDIQAIYRPSNDRSVLSREFAEENLGLDIAILTNDVPLGELRIKVYWCCKDMKYEYRTLFHLSAEIEEDVIFGVYDPFENEDGYPNPFENAVKHGILKTQNSCKKKRRERKKVSWPLQGGPKNSSRAHHNSAPTPLLAEEPRVAPQIEDIRMTTSHFNGQRLQGDQDLIDSYQDHAPEHFDVQNDCPYGTGEVRLVSGSLENAEVAIQRTALNNSARNSDQRSITPKQTTPDGETTGVQVPPKHSTRKTASNVAENSDGNGKLAIGTQHQVRSSESPKRSKQSETTADNSPEIVSANQFSRIAAAESFTLKRYIESQSNDDELHEGERLRRKLSAEGSQLRNGPPVRSNGRHDARLKLGGFKETIPTASNPFVISPAPSAQDYWTWDTTVQEWYHKNEETGSIEWFEPLD
jgi:hypothetical protein